VNFQPKLSAKNHHQLYKGLFPWRNTKQHSFGLISIMDGSSKLIIGSKMQKQHKKAMTKNTIEVM